MNILFICENYYPHRGGAETLFQNLAERYVQQGHNVTILTHRLRNRPRTETKNGVRIQRVHSFHSRYVFSFSALIPALRQARKYDIIQTTTFNGAFPAWVAGRISRKPVVITIHEVWVGKWKEVTGFSTFQSSLHSCLERMIYLLPFQKYICVSNATQDDLLKLKINPTKTETIYNGVDYHFWNQKQTSFQEIQRFKMKHQLETAFTCFAWGRPGPSKGFEYLIAAVPELKKRIPSFRLFLLFGSSEQYLRKHAQLLSQIKDGNHYDTITLLPPAGPEEIRTILASVDCAVVPSLAEGFGYNAAEAMAMNVPLVTSNAGSLPEVISGKFQLCQKKDPHDLAESIVKIFRHQYQTKKPRRFTWEKTIGSYLSAYNSLLPAPREEV